MKILSVSLVVILVFVCFGAADWKEKKSQQLVKYFVDKHCPEKLVNSVSCSHKRDPGMCMAHMPRYHFNSVTQKCELFTYGGCQGNDNNFETKAACMETCPRAACQSSCNTRSCRKMTGMCRVDEDCILCKCLE